MKLSRFALVGLVFATALCVVWPQQRCAASLLTYSLTSGTFTISGTVGSQAFANATWVATVTVDSSGVLSGISDTRPLGQGNTLPTYFLPATISLTINDPISGPTSMILNSPGGATTGIVSYDYDRFASGVGANSLVALSGSGSVPSPWVEDLSFGFNLATGGALGGTPNSYNTLSTTGTWLGGTVLAGASSASTNLGNLSFAESNAPGTGTFAITAVPEPSTIAGALMGVGILGRVMTRRRRRKGG